MTFWLWSAHRSSPDNPKCFFPSGSEGRPQYSAFSVITGKPSTRVFMGQNWDRKQIQGLPWHMSLKHVPQCDQTLLTRPRHHQSTVHSALGSGHILKPSQEVPRKLFWTTQQWTVRDGSSESQQVFREQHHGLCFVNSFVQCVMLRNRVAIILTNYKMISESIVLD